MKDELANKIRIFLENNGLNPVYTTTLVVIILFTLTYYKSFKNWHKIEPWERGLASSSLAAAIALSLLSILMLLGILKL